MLESNISRFLLCLASKPITLHGWINKLQIAATRSLSCRVCWIGPGRGQVGWLVQASKVSHFHTFGPWIYSLPSLFLCLKVSWQLELIWLSKQKPKAECAGFCPVMRSSGFPPGWLTKWPPNGLQKGLLEIWDLDLQGGMACRKLPHQNHPPKDKQNRAVALTFTPELRSFRFGFGWPTKWTPNDLKLDLLEI